MSRSVVTFGSGPTTSGGVATLSCRWSWDGNSLRYAAPLEMEISLMEMVAYQTGLTTWCIGYMDFIKFSMD